jgi:hypothetical protein
VVAYSLLIALAVFLLSMFVSGACALLVRRCVRVEVLRSHHDTLAHYILILTAMYGLLLAFVYLSLWEDQRDAAEQVAVEAGELQSLFRLAGSFPESDKQATRAAALAYAQHVLDQEWPQMRRRRLGWSEYVPGELKVLWAAVIGFEPQTERERVLLASAVDAFDRLQQARRERISYSGQSLAPYLWLVLILGGVLIFGCTLFIGMDQLGSQLVLTGICAGWIVVLLFVVRDLQNPFQGYWAVGSEPFQHALERIEGGLETLGNVSVSPSSPISK